MAVDSFRTRLVTRSLTLLKRRVVRPMALADSLVSSDDECSVAGKLNFLFDGSRFAFSSVVGGVSSSDDVKITSGVNIVRVGFVITATIANCSSLQLKLIDR